MDSYRLPNLALNSAKLWYASLRSVYVLLGRGWPWTAGTALTTIPSLTYWGVNFGSLNGSPVRSSIASKAPLRVLWAKPRPSRSGRWFWGRTPRPPRSSNVLVRRTIFCWIPMPWSATSVACCSWASTGVALAVSGRREVHQRHLREPFRICCAHTGQCSTGHLLFIAASLLHNQATRCLLGWLRCCWERLSKSIT